MTIIRYVDIYKTDETSEGLVDTLTVKDATLPMVIDSTRVNSIQPYFNGNGRMFKNVSYLNYDGELLKVVGNYKLLERSVLDNSKQTRVQVKGYFK